ncbi:hypothetical protein [Saccharothrix sp. NRRL B-16348]|uniref:hypothetical protein n=1 Tax=Saccharothrix sp. NRRL B-16348 TaxID=1415542 RepID=UPI0012FC2B55|nr:hypothetical protein [Saccharothrix sp. NRRL B-16348]
MNPFRVREFRFLWVAEVLSVLGDQLARVALAVLVYGRTESALWAAAVYALRVVRSIAGDPRRRVLVLLAWLVGWYVVPEALAAPYADQLGAGPAVVGVLMAADPLGSVLGAWLFVRFVPASHRARLVGVLAVCAGIPLVLCAFLNSPALVAHGPVLAAGRPVLVRHPRSSCSGRAGRPPRTRLRGSRRRDGSLASSGHRVALSPAPVATGSCPSSAASGHGTSADPARPAATAPGPP